MSPNNVVNIELIHLASMRRSAPGYPAWELFSLTVLFYSVASRPKGGQSNYLATKGAAKRARPACGPTPCSVADAQA